MADYSYASIQIGGLIPNVDAAKALVGAILAEGLCDNEDEARLALLTAIRENKTAGLEDEQVSGGTFDFINDAVRMIPGVSCATSYSQSGGYGAGYLGIDADGIEHCATGDGGEPTISLRALVAACAEPIALLRGIALGNLIMEASIASGTQVPPLSAPLPVLAWLDTGDERGEIEGGDEATSSEIATANEMYGSDDINIDAHAHASRGDDGTWVQAWVLIPNDEEDE